MGRRLRIGITAFVLLVSTKAVFAQQTIKTPPLKDSDVFKFQVHNPGPIPNWAGSYLKIHVLDNAEADVVGLKNPFTPVTLPLISPVGDPSHNIVSVPHLFTYIDPRGPQSGIQVPASAPLWTITLHAKNTSPRNNSDIDYTIMWRNIIHLPPAETTHMIPIPASFSIWAPSTWNVSNNALPQPIPLQDPLGQWKHFVQAHTFHVPEPGYHGSNFIRSPWNAVNLGIEHVPEPMSTAVWLGGGAFCLAIGCWTRRRRLRVP